jgi:hypothetical protein
MYKYRSILFLGVVAIALPVLTINIVALTPLAMTAVASSSTTNKGQGAVTQEKVNTGDLILDKGINAFYRCISKTHQDPPTIDIVYNCYYQSLGGSTTNYPLTGSSNTASSASTTLTTPSSHHTSHYKHGISTTTMTPSNSDTIQGGIPTRATYSTLNNRG